MDTTHPAPLRLALVQGNAVQNIVMGSTDYQQEQAPNWQAVLEAPAECEIGWPYDPDTGQIQPPADEAPEAEPAPRTRISVGAFFDRFGAAKWPILADTSPSVQALIKDCSVRTFIDLARPDLPAALGLLVQAGHAVDPDAILSAPVLEAELP